MPAQYRLFVRAPLIASILGLALMGTFAKRGFLDWRRMVHQNENLSSKLVSLRAQREQLDFSIEQLQKNPDEQERVVRQVLGYIRPNETVIEFP